MKKMLLLMVFHLIITSLFAQSTNSPVRTIEQVISHSGKDILIDLKCNVETKTWEGNKIKLIIEIEYNNQKTSLIKELARMERYDIKVVENDYFTIVSMPNIHEIVKINNVYLDETLNIKLMVPQALGNKVCFLEDLEYDLAGF
ncbi:MAG: hypothetical protein AAF502_05250 [Bacteroidota bacterium]